MFIFELFVLLFVVAINALVGVKSWLESLRVLLFVFSLFFLSFVAVVVVLEGIKMQLVLFTEFLFVFTLFVLLIAVVVIAFALLHSNLRSHKEMKVEHGF